MLRIGTRESKLAMWQVTCFVFACGGLFVLSALAFFVTQCAHARTPQATLVAERLQTAYPELKIEGMFLFVRPHER